MKGSIYLLLLVSLLGCHQQKMTDKEELKQTKVVEEPTFPEFLLYGELAPDGYLNYATDSITEQYGFRVKRIAGCEISVMDVAKAHVQNTESMNEMNHRYGEDWQEKFTEATGLELWIPNEENL